MIFPFQLNFFVMAATIALTSAVFSARDASTLFKNDLAITGNSVHNKYTFYLQLIFDHFDIESRNR